jgi:hypothetical protein
LAPWPHLPAPGNRPSEKSGEPHFPHPGSRIGNSTLWGTPAMLRQLAQLATQAAIQAEEEAAWQTRAATTTAARARDNGRVA